MSKNRLPCKTTASISLGLTGKLVKFQIICTPIMILQIVLGFILASMELHLPGEERPQNARAECALLPHSFRRHQCFVADSLARHVGDSGQVARPVVVVS